MITSLKLTLAAASLVCGTAFITAEVVRADASPNALLQEPEAMDPAMMEAMMAHMEEAAKPGPEHKELAGRAGKWNLKMKMTMPGMPPMETPATQEIKSVLGGRYTIAHHDGEFMGKPFNGLLIQGFDKLTGEYIQIWMDNLGTAPSISRGKKQEDGNIVLSGLMRDTMSPEGRPFKSIVKPHGADREIFEMYDTIPPFGEVLVMTIDAERAK